MLLRFILSNLKYYIHTPKITELQCTQQLFQPGASHYQKLRKLGNLWVCLGEVPALTRTLPLGLSLQSGSQRLPGPAHQATSRYSRLCLSCVLLPQPVGLRRHLPQSTLRMPLPAPGSTARHPEQSAGATPLLRTIFHLTWSQPLRESQSNRSKGYNAVSGPGGARGQGQQLQLPGDNAHVGGQGRTWDVGRLQRLLRSVGTRGTAGTTYPSCKAHPPSHWSVPEPSPRPQ